jgi:hypothetical protein
VRGGDGEAGGGEEGGDEEDGKRPCQPQQLRKNPFINDAAESQAKDKAKNET